MIKEVKYLIIGAGVSGLSFATQKEDYIILEKEVLPGGLARSFYKNGFVWDVAGHFFHFHSPETRAYYEKLMQGKEQVTAKKCAKVYYAGQYMDAPFQYNIHQLPQNEFLECLTDLYYAKYSHEDLQFDEFVKSKYGNGIANKFLIPYNEKLYACKMNDLEKNSMGGFLPKLDFEMLMSFYKGSKGKTYNDTFRYPVNGCAEIIDALMESLDKDRVHFNERVIAIDVSKKTVRTEAGEYRYSYLINTMPLLNFAKLCGKTDCDDLVSNQVLVLNMGFDRESIDKEVSWIYFPGTEIFYRVGFYNNIAGTKKLSIYVEIGYSSKENIDVDSAVKRTLNDLKKVNIIKDHNLVAYNSYIINPGYAHITTKGKEYTNALCQEMEQLDVHMIGRYARWEYSAMDDSFEQVFQLAERI